MLDEPFMCIRAYAIDLESWKVLKLLVRNMFNNKFISYGKLANRKLSEIEKVGLKEMKYFRSLDFLIFLHDNKFTMLLFEMANVGKNLRVSKF